MNSLISILYICDVCRKIRQYDVSMNKLESEGDILKVRDKHANHEAILYLSQQYIIETVLFDPPALLMKEPIIKGLTVYEEVPEEEELFAGANRIFTLTKNIDNLPIHFRLQRLILLNMDGKKTLADILKGLTPHWPDLSSKYIQDLVQQCEIRGWILEQKPLKDLEE